MLQLLATDKLRGTSCCAGAAAGLLNCAPVHFSGICCTVAGVGWCYVKAVGSRLLFVGDDVGDDGFGGEAAPDAQFWNVDRSRAAPV